MTEMIDEKNENSSGTKNIVTSVLLPFVLPFILIVISFIPFFIGGNTPQSPDQYVTNVMYVWSIMSYLGWPSIIVVIIHLIPTITQIVLLTKQKQNSKVIYIESFFSILLFVFTLVAAIMGQKLRDRDRYQKKSCYRLKMMAR